MENVFRWIILKKKRDKCLFVLHTDPVSDHGTDLPAVIEYLFGSEDDTSVCIYQSKTYLIQHMNYLYNMADGVILLSCC